MRHLAILAALLLCAPAQAQTLKTLSYNTNGDVVYGGTNTLTFTNAQVRLSPVVLIGTNFASIAAGGNFVSMTDANGDTVFLANTNRVTFYDAIAFSSATNRAATRANLELGATNIVTFAGLTNNGDISINQTTATNGLFFIRRTNNEAFLGMANLIASNNVTVSNETLFRVGRAEATNQSAQFGFRVVRTNNGGEGFATFSVFGYNALMMIGPSDRSRTNTATNAAIEADIYTISGSNRVMTLRDTNTGAMTLHQDLGFGASLTNNAPTNTNTPALWLRVWVGTNNYRLPLYQ